MSWALAIFLCFSISVISVFTFLLVVYIKEYNREEQTIKEMMKAKDNFNKMMKDAPPLYYIATPPTKKKVAAPPAQQVVKSDKNKKDIN